MHMYMYINELTGIPSLIFIIGDRIVCPPELQADYSEAMVLVANSYFVSGHRYQYRLDNPVQVSRVTHVDACAHTPGHTHAHTHTHIHTHTRTHTHAHTNTHTHTHTNTHMHPHTHIHTPSTGKDDNSSCLSTTHYVT